jgi:hypothetical protein
MAGIYSLALWPGQDRTGNNVYEDEIALDCGVRVRVDLLLAKEANDINMRQENG